MMPEVVSGLSMEAAKVPNVPRQQVSRAPGNRRLEDWTVLPGQSCGEPQFRTMFHELDDFQQGCKVFTCVRELPFKVAACFLHGIGAGREHPVAVLTQLDGHRPPYRSDCAQP